jgi:hypothetical protein
MGANEVAAIRGEYGLGAKSGTLGRHSRPKAGFLRRIDRQTRSARRRAALMTKCAVVIRQRES